MASTGQALRLQAVRKLGLAAIVAGTAIAGAMLPNEAAQARPAASRTVLLLELPQEAIRTYRAIRSGGPFAYEKDGSVFGNRERRLPEQPRGFYREYTVRTPGASDRGARRIICGGKQPTAPETCYYTADHYASFSRIID